MALIKTPAQIAKMRESGRIVARTMRLVSESIVPNRTTLDELNILADRLIREEGGVPSFLGYGEKPFPASICASVNDHVVHGVPSKRKLRPGDIVSLDFGVVKDGWHADGAWTFPVGDISREAQRLLNVTQESLFQGIAKAKVGGTIGDIGAAVQRYVERAGYSVVTQLVGHGIGEKLHDEPKNVPMTGKPGKGDRLREGMCMCIEPMVNAGKAEVVTLEDKWTVATEDGSPSAHFEHTVAITKSGPVILTIE